MKNKQFLAAGVGVATVAIMFSFQDLPADLSPFLPLQGIELLSAGFPASIPNTSSRVADEAWSVFEEYLRYARDHDAEGIMSISHLPSMTCSDPARREECEALMDTGYSRGSSLNREDFTNIWSDDKQIILSTDYQTVDNASANIRGRYRSIIYFSRNTIGEPRLIGFNPYDGVFVNKLQMTSDEVDSRLDTLTRDTDKDGRLDEDEVCSNSITSSEGCVPTDPYDPDTDGDGWWDGIQALFR